MPAWRRWARTGVGLVGAVIGTLIATAPTHRGLTAMAGGDFKSGVGFIREDVGVPENQPPNITKLIGTGITVGVGIGIIKLFRLVAQRV
jgi:hypothetical protein